MCASWGALVLSFTNPNPNHFDRHFILWNALKLKSVCPGEKRGGVSSNCCLFAFFMSLLMSVTLWDGRSAWLTTFNTLQVLSPYEADPDLTAISCLHDFMLFISTAKLFCSTFNERVRIKSGITTSRSVWTRTRNLCLYVSARQPSVNSWLRVWGYLSCRRWPSYIIF